MSNIIRKYGLLPETLIQCGTGYFGLVDLAVFPVRYHQFEGMAERLMLKYQFNGLDAEAITLAHLLSLIVLKRIGTHTYQIPPGRYRFVVVTQENPVVWGHGEVLDSYEGSRLQHVVADHVYYDPQSVVHFRLDHYLDVGMAAHFPHLERIRLICTAGDADE